MRHPPNGEPQAAKDPHHRGARGLRELASRVDGLRRAEQRHLTKGDGVHRDGDVRVQAAVNQRARCRLKESRKRAAAPQFVVLVEEHDAQPCLVCGSHLPCERGAALAKPRLAVEVEHHEVGGAHDSLRVRRAVVVVVPAIADDQRRHPQPRPLAGFKGGDELLGHAFRAGVVRRGVELGRPAKVANLFKCDVRGEAELEAWLG
mmetsp:Transcript_40824/g.135167  ORF Transcript_40824/g.135167 Transcript_40824/m.135167 type:complete len:204 (+) Transcript_40824:110-721(+)